MLYHAVTIKLGHTFEFYQLNFTKALLVNSSVFSFGSLDDKGIRSNFTLDISRGRFSVFFRGSLSTRFKLEPSLESSVDVLDFLLMPKTNSDVPETHPQLAVNGKN